MRLSTGRGPRRALSLVFIAAVVATVAACSGGAATPAPSASAAASANIRRNSSIVAGDGSIRTDHSLKVIA